MFYRDTRTDFKLPDGSPSTIAGSIVAASAIKAARLTRRPFKAHSYLQHRLLDPQMYLADLSKDTYSGVVSKLCTYPWFHATAVPEYATKLHGKFEIWEKEFGPKLMDEWLGCVVRDMDTARECARRAIELQIRLECEAVILPGPMTRVASKGLALEMQWLDAGLTAFRSLDLPLPVFATVALTQDLLAGEEPESSPFLATLADQVTARDVDGVYLVVEQTVDQ